MARQRARDWRTYACWRAWEWVRRAPLAPDVMARDAAGAGADRPSPTGKRASSRLSARSTGSRACARNAALSASE